MVRVFLAIVVLTLASCTTGERMSSIQPGMSQAQVVSVLGQPDGQSVSGEFTEMRYTNRIVSGWGWDRADYSVVLQGDQVVSYGATEVRQNRPNTLMLMQVPFPGQ